MRCLILVLFIAVATCKSIAYARTENSVDLPVRAVIINLTQMPTEKAIAFCNQRNLECPAIRDKAEEARKDRNHPPKKMAKL